MNFAITYILCPMYFREDEKSSEEAHETFMTNYKEIFAKPPSKRIFHAQSKKR